MRIAYADPGSAAARNERFSGNGAADPVLGAVRQVAQLVSHQFDEQSLMMVIAGFALGYMTTLMYRG